MESNTELDRMNKEARKIKEISKNDNVILTIVKDAISSVEELKNGDGNHEVTVDQVSHSFYKALYERQIKLIHYEVCGDEDSLQFQQWDVYTPEGRSYAITLEDCSSDGYCYHSPKLERRCTKYDRIPIFSYSWVCRHELSHFVIVYRESV